MPLAFTSIGISTRGLSIVKHICEIHGATISVTSDPDCTVFTVVWRPGKTEAAG